MNKKTKRKLKRIAALGLLGVGAKMGLSKMAENRAIKESAMSAKPMFATEMNRQRVPAFIKKRGIKGGNPLRPRGNITGQTFGIDPFGPGMGAKKGKMIKARGGRLARVKPTKMM
jgi:hypothetical protein|tara:strand:- start:546 stop:890 length:345 start_codon:yes stop_codon:yes gene_type:complete